MKQLCRNEKGLTLVEVLASIVILSIVVTTFLLVFSQTAKTTKQSEDKVDATYIAQTEMENMYEMSQSYTPEETYAELKSKGYSEPVKSDTWDVFEKEGESGSFHLIISLQELPDKGMTRVLIEVKHAASDEHSIAQMENLFKWKD